MGLSGINAVFARAVWYHLKALSAYKKVLPVVPDRQTKQVIEGIVQEAERSLEALNSALSTVSPENEQEEQGERFVEKDRLITDSPEETVAVGGEQEVASEPAPQVILEPVMSAEGDAVGVLGTKEPETEEPAPEVETSDPHQVYLQAIRDLIDNGTPLDASLEEQEPETVVPPDSPEPGEVLVEIALQKDEITNLEGKPEVIVWKGF